MYTIVETTLKYLGSHLYLMRDCISDQIFLYLK